MRGVRRRPGMRGHYLSPQQVLWHEETLTRFMSHCDVARASVETDRGVPREQRFEIEVRELGNTCRRFLDRAVVDVLQDHAAATEDRVPREEVAPLPAAEKQRDVAVAVPRCLEDLQLQVADRDTVCLPHLAR